MRPTKTGDSPLCGHLGGHLGVKAAALVMGTAAIMAIALPGCSDDGGGGGDNLPPPVLLLRGPTIVTVGESVTLSVSTINGTDTSYTWVSSDETVATVDDRGMVTGQAVGEADIMVTGANSRASTSVAITVTTEVPNFSAWLGSAHADSTAEAFRHWDEDDPREVPTECARCHSAPGFIDYIGADGSEVHVVEQAAPTGTVISCEACHNAVADELDQVLFPSGVTLTDLGAAEARCMTCHQGRSSFDSVSAEIAAAGVGDDETSADLHFINIHYYAAGATLNAGRVRGGYQYGAELGAVYDWRFRHVPGLETCTGCHDPHSLEVKVDRCAGCHTDIETVEDLRNIRMLASQGSDYDGDGDLSEGIYYEIQGLRDLLLTGISRYAEQQGLGAVCYSDTAYPYFFGDTDGNGACSEAEAAYGNRFASWTPRLLKAAYNLQVASKDPGGFAHNGKYIIQLLFDSITDLDTVLTEPVDLSAAERNDPGHFNGSSEAARHWDEDEEVSASCSKCHSGSVGLRFFLEFGVGISVEEQDNGMDCATCHDDLSSDYTLVTVDSISFPSGIEVTGLDNATNLCGTCHSGRESKATIDEAISQNRLGFRNVHYLPGAAVKLGVDAQVGYEYDGKTYAGDWDHQPGNPCTFCHDPDGTKHSFDVIDTFTKCTELCHTTAASPEDIRGNPFSPGVLHAGDYDGDGDTAERLVDELAPLAAALLAEMQTTAQNGGSSLCYSASAYPYFFQDSNDNGVCDPEEANYGNRFNAWTPALMKAAHNYQISQKDPGGWAHNFDYLAQLLIDSTEDLGGAGAVSDFTRP
ncbi:Ig-like domain-containing protein [Haliangium sp.]|uniref:Ig-like domain-containing protein n=1 Tax=Haliangium sp. TaxID=2663208 RepID=UPI003D0C6184